MSERSKALWALVVLTLVWGESWVWWRQMLDLAGPFTASFHRLLLAGVSIFLVMRLRGNRLALGTPLWPTIWIAVTQTGLFFILQVWAVLQSGAGKTSILIFTMPVWMLLMSGPLLGERIRPLQWLPVAVTVAGLLVFIAPWQQGSVSLGQVAALGAALCWAISGVLTKRLAMQQPIDNFNLNAWQMLIGMVMLAGVVVMVPEQPVQWGWHYSGLLIVLGVFSSAGGWLLWGYILKRLPAWQASLSVLGIPVVANVSAHWTLGERFTAPEFSGMLLIGVGLALLSVLAWWGQRSLRH